MTPCVRGHRLNRVLFVALAAVALVGCRSTAPTTRPVAPPPTPEQRTANLESFDQVWVTIRDKHFDPTLHGVDWEAVRVELRPQVENAKSNAEATEVMEEMLTRLGQTHFAIIPAAVYVETSKATESDESSEAVAESPATAPASAPSPKDDKGTCGIELRVVDGIALVTSVQPDSGGAKAGVKTGWILKSVRGKPVAPILKAIDEQVKLESLKPTMQSRSLEAALGGKAGIAVSATFLDGRDKEIKLQIPVQAETGSMTAFGNLPKMRVRWECRRVQPDISYFWMSIFLDPMNVMTAFRECVRSAVGDGGTPAGGFILDLRGNPGGIGAMAPGIANHFITERGQKLGEMTGRGGVTIMKFNVDPQPLHFDGPLAVLIDERSGSTSEILAAGLQDLGRARIFGTRSAGAALPSQIVILPNGDRFQYAVSNYVSEGGAELEGKGVTPDEVVAPTRAALLEGHDPVLDAAVRWIESQEVK